MDLQKSQGKNKNELKSTETNSRYYASSFIIFLIMHIEIITTT